MSKNNLIALAIAAALASPSAFAFEVKTDGTTVATVDIKDATTAVALDSLSVDVLGTDLIIGRTTGFSVRVELSGGAEFAHLGAPAVGSALGTPDDPNTTANENTLWSVSLASGGPGFSYAVYSVQPTATSKGIVAGPALTWTANDITIDNAAGLAKAGATLSTTVTFADPNTAQEILKAQTAQIAKSANPLVFSIDTAAGDLKARVDVGSTVTYGSKMSFSPDGDVGDTAQTLRFNAGQVHIDVATGINAVDDATATFAWDAADTVELTVDGKLGAFATAGVVLNDAGTCAAATDGQVGVVDSAKAVISGTFAQVDGEYLCFVAPGTKVIEATAVNANAVVERTATGGTNSGSDDALSLAYNGAVRHVYHFNPSANVAQESFLRLTNTSAVSGKITIDGICDDGTASVSPASFELGAGRSILLTSKDIEGGNAVKGLSQGLGACTADGAAGVTSKYRLTITGEVGSLEVQNFIRNVNSAGTTTTNVNNAD
jgi:hypothetical protein